MAPEDGSEEWKSRPPYGAAAADAPPFEKRWTAHCSCGRVTYWLSRDRPLASKYCHCVDCQSLHGAPFQWAAIFHKEDVHFARGGAEGLAFYSARDGRAHHRPPCKVSCAYCHTPIMDEGRNVVLVFPGIIRADDPERKRKWFDPQCHIFYSQRVVDIPDGKPKWTKMDGVNQLVDDVGDLKEVERVASKEKLGKAELEGQGKGRKEKEEKAGKGGEK